MNTVYVIGAAAALGFLAYRLVVLSKVEDL
jgi:hypothetical protein